MSYAYQNVTYDKKKIARPAEDGSHGSVDGKIRHVSEYGDTRTHFIFQMFLLCTCSKTQEAI